MPYCGRRLCWWRHCHCRDVVKARPPDLCCDWRVNRSPGTHVQISPLISGCMSWSIVSSLPPKYRTSLQFINHIISSITMSTNQQPNEVPIGQNNGSGVAQPLLAAASASTTATAPPNNTNSNNQPQDSDANNNAPKPKKKRKAPISSKAKQELLGYFRRVISGAAQIIVQHCRHRKQDPSRTR